MGRNVALLTLLVSLTAACEKTHYNLEELPSDRTFLEGVWVANVSDYSPNPKITILDGQVIGQNIPNTKDYSPPGRLNYSNHASTLKLVEWASGAAFFLNDYDPIYIRKLNGRWALVQDIYPPHGTEIRFFKRE